MTIESGEFGEIPAVNSAHTEPTEVEMARLARDVFYKPIGQLGLAGVLEDQIAPALVDFVVVEYPKPETVGLTKTIENSRLRIKGNPDGTLIGIYPSRGGDRSLWSVEKDDSIIFLDRGTIDPLPLYIARLKNLSDPQSSPYVREGYARKTRATVSFKTEL